MAHGGDEGVARIGSGSADRRRIRGRRRSRGRDGRRNAWVGPVGFGWEVVSLFLFNAGGRGALIYAMGGWDARNGAGGSVGWMRVFPAELAMNGRIEVKGTTQRSSKFTQHDPSQEPAVTTDGQKFGAVCQFHQAFST